MLINIVIAMTFVSVHFNLLVATLHLCFFLLQVVYNGKELNHPFGISHYRNYIFWTEYMNASVFQLELSTGDVTLLRSERPPLFGLRVYDAQSQQGELLLCFQYWWNMLEAARHCPSCVPGHWDDQNIIYNIHKTIYLHMILRSIVAVSWASSV